MVLSISLKTEQIEHCPNYPLLAELYMVYACPYLVGWGTRGGGGVPDLLLETSYLLNLHSKTTRIIYQ